MAELMNIGITDKINNNFFALARYLCDQDLVTDISFMLEILVESKSHLPPILRDRSV